MYALEKAAREQGLGPESRWALRRAQSLPVMTALKARLVAVRQHLLPGGKLAQACDYALGQWSRLEEYLRDGRLEIDNNWCEGAMRPLALGRKNWLHIGSPEAGPKVAAIASIVSVKRAACDGRLASTIRSGRAWVSACTGTAWAARLGRW